MKTVMILSSEYEVLGLFLHLPCHEDGKRVLALALLICLPEHRGAVDAHVAVTLLETAVFAHKVQVVAPNDNGALHLGLADHAGQNATTDPHITGPGALLVDVGTIDGL